MAGYDCPAYYHYVSAQQSCESDFFVYLPVQASGTVILNWPRSGANKPKTPSPDYKQAVCDIVRVLHPGMFETQPGATNVTIFYDDGSADFDCARP